MKSKLLSLSLAMCLGHHSSADAGLNLGMKMAVGEYAKAWKSGSRSELRGASTGDFIRMWERMPSEQFRGLPRQGDGKILGSHKSDGHGTVTVSTGEGVMTFVLVGSGFRWKVADIYKPGDDGRTVSVKNYLDASLTAWEFMRDLKNVGGTAFHDSLSDRFRDSFAGLDAADLNRIRGMLPPIPTNSKPNLVFAGDQANMTVRIPGQGPKDVARFRLVRDGGWKVDDYSIESSTVSIASFREALPALACTSAFAEFIQSPSTVDPHVFTSVGTLRNELAHARQMKPFPIPSAERRESLLVTGDCMCVLARYSGRSVRMTVCKEGGKSVLRKIEVNTAGQWLDLSQVLALNRAITSVAGNSMWASLRDGGQASEPSVLTNVAARQAEPKRALGLAAAPSTSVGELKPIPRETSVEPKKGPTVYSSVQPVRYIVVPQRVHRKAMRRRFR